MAERAILTGLIALVLLTALVKMGPSLSASFEQVGGLHQAHDPAKAIDHRQDEARAREVLNAHDKPQKQDER
ncbi:MAG: hypothetical protein AAGJ85_08955 [Pseudomonadota bacterium]